MPGASVVAHHNVVIRAAIQRAPRNTKAGGIAARERDEISRATS